MVAGGCGGKNEAPGVRDAARGLGCGCGHRGRGGAAGGVLVGHPAAARLPATAPAPTSHTASMTAGGRTRASLDVLTGTTVLTIGTASFGPGGSLLTVTTPAGTPVPQLSASDPDGTGNGTLVDLSAPNAPAVTVTLNAGVSWQIDLDGGATRTDVDLRGGQLSGIAFNAGSSLVTLALPRPHGSVPVQMIGGASDFQLSLPTGVPARVTAGGGASEVIAGGPGAHGRGGRVGVHHHRLGARRDRLRHRRYSGRLADHGDRPVQLTALGIARSLLALTVSLAVNRLLPSPRADGQGGADGLVCGYATSEVALTPRAVRRPPSLVRIFAIDPVQELVRAGRAEAERRRREAVVPSDR